MLWRWEHWDQRIKGKDGGSRARRDLGRIICFDHQGIKKSPCHFLLREIPKRKTIFLKREKFQKRGYCHFQLVNVKSIVSVDTA